MYTMNFCLVMNSFIWIMTHKWESLKIEHFYNFACDKSHCWMAYNFDCWREWVIIQTERTLRWNHIYETLHFKLIWFGSHYRKAYFLRFECIHWHDFIHQSGNLWIEQFIHVPNDYRIQWTFDCFTCFDDIAVQKMKECDKPIIKLSKNKQWEQITRVSFTTRVQNPVAKVE